MVAPVKLSALKHYVCRNGWKVLAIRRQAPADPQPWLATLLRPDGTRVSQWYGDDGRWCCMPDRAALKKGVLPLTSELDLQEVKP